MAKSPEDGLASLIRKGWNSVSRACANCRHCQRERQAIQAHGYHAPSEIPVHLGIPQV